jgi:hypothetical protein
MPMAGPSMGGLGQIPGISFGRSQARVGFGRRSAIPRFVAPAGFPLFFGDDEPSTVVVEDIVPSPTEEQAKVNKPVFDERVPELPLILEKQGDQWVRRTPDQYGPREETEAARPSHAAPMARTILVFRDGQRAEVSRYVIVDQTLYENAEHWTRRIQLAELDLAATVRMNRQRGVEFRLPLDHEVVTRP